MTLLQLFESPLSATHCTYCNSRREKKRACDDHLEPGKASKISAAPLRPCGAPTLSAVVVGLTYSSNLSGHRTDQTAFYSNQSIPTLRCNRGMKTVGTGTRSHPELVGVAGDVGSGWDVDVDGDDNAVGGSQR